MTKSTKSNKKRIKLFTAIRDTREHENHGWWFDENDHTTAGTIACKGTIERKVDVGDYTIEGLEDVLCIERKKSVSEFAQNCTEKRFVRELEKMRDIPHSYVLFEFSWFDIFRYPEGSDIPKSRWKHLKIKGNYIASYIAKASMEYGVHFIPCGDKYTAKKVCYSLLKMAGKIYEARL